MFRTLYSIASLIVFLVVFQLVTINLTGGAGGSLGIRPVTHKCVGLTIDGVTTSALPSGDWRFDYLLHVHYQLPENREGLQLCLGQDVWSGE